MTANKNLTIEVSLSEQEAHNIIEELDEMLTKLSNNSILEMQELDTILAFKNTLALSLV